MTKFCPRCKQSFPAGVEWCPDDGAPLLTGSGPAPCAKVLGGRWCQGEVVERGGFGAVHRGQDLRSGQPVAIKVLHPERARDPEFVQRFVREAHLLRLVDHPALLRGLDHGHDDETGWYLVSEWLPGVSLRQRLLLGGPLTWAELDVLAADVLAGLSALHDAGVIHRDIHVDNVQWVPAADVVGARPVLLDFGVARTTAAADRRLPVQLHELTRPRQVVGSPWSISPEQVLAQPVDQRADLYGVGVLLFESMTGQPPFRAERPGLVMRAHVFDPPPQPSSLRGDIAEGVERLVLDLLAKSPASRPASALETLLRWQDARGWGLGRFAAAG